MKELYKFKNRDEYIKALDSVMPDTFIQSRDVGSTKHRYIPAAIKEAIADDLFHYWNITDEKYTIIVNELICTVKITFIPSYPSADEIFCTGSAAIPIQMDANSKITDFPAKKKTNALEYNLPSVRSEAISKALGTLGNIFGRNLSRKLNKKQNIADGFTIRSHEPDKEKPKTKEPEVVEKPNVDIPF